MDAKKIEALVRYLAGSAKNDDVREVFTNYARGLTQPGHRAQFWAFAQRLYPLAGDYPWGPLPSGQFPPSNPDDCFDAGTQAPERERGRVGKREKILRLGVLAVAVSFLALFAYTVWPTPYRYEHVQYRRQSTVVRIHRLTGDGEVLWVNGWKPLGAAFAEPAPPPAPPSGPQ